MKLTKTSAWSLGTTGLCVAVAASSWFLAIEPERAEAAESRELTVAAEQSNAELEVRVEQLRLEYAELPARQAELAAIRQALPDEPALAELIRQLTAAAADAGVVLDSINAGAVTAVVDDATVTAAPEPVADEPADGEEPAEGEAAAEPSAEPSAAPDAAAGDAPADAAAVPTGGPVLVSVPITIQTTGDFSTTTLFLKNVQAQIDRAFLVDGLTVTVEEGEDTAPGTIASNLTGRVFVFVDSTTVAGASGAVSAPAQPAPTQTVATS